MINEHIIISQGETKSIGFLGIDPDFDPVRITRILPVTGEDYSHIAHIEGNCGVFNVGSQIYLDLEGSNACYSGCYLVDYIDECRTIIGFTASACIAAQDNTITVTNCCGVATTRINTVGWGYKPYDVSSCGSIASHIRLLSSHDVLLPPVLVNATAGSNSIVTPRRNRGRVQKGLYVSVNGIECLILEVIETNAHNISIVLDQTMQESGCQIPMCFSKEPIAVMTVGAKDKSCYECGWIQMRIPQDQSMRLLPGVIYHWDIMGYFEDRTQKLGAGTIEVLATYTF